MRSCRVLAAAAGVREPLVALVPLDPAALGAPGAAGDPGGGGGRRRQSRRGAELGAHYAGFGAVAAAGELPLERVARGADEQVVGGRDTAADHEAGRVEGGGEVGDSDAEPLADVLEQLDAHRVALAGEFRDHR